MRQAIGAGAFVLCALLLACVPLRGGWDETLLTRRHPQLGDDGHRLGDLAPHLLVADGELMLFLCRWDTNVPIPVVLPSEATAEERDMLRHALVAWADAGLGVRFAEVDETSGGIHFRFVARGDPGPLPTGAGDTIADCRIDDGAVRGDRVVASLRYASIHLRRDQVDLLGLSWPLGEDERYGAALHEIGHALGFASHVAAGSSIMRPSPETARHAGAALREGQWTGDSSLAALYAIPSGTVVGRLRLSPDAAEQVAQFAAVARRANLAGPYSRVGDRSAQIGYRDSAGRPVALRVRPWPASGDGGGIELVPNVRAERLLDASDSERP